MSIRRIVLAGLCAALCVACGDDARDSAAVGLTDAETPADLARQVRAMMPALERLSGLDRTDVLRVRRQDRAAARAYVQTRLDSELPPAERAAIRRTYVALGLIPDTLDIDALMLDLYTEQVLGYYDPTTKTLYVVDTEGLDALRPTLAHELVHALQDQRVDLDSLISRERGNDRQVAAHAAMEGHAMIVMFAFLAEQESGGIVDPTSLPNPALELAPALEAQNAEFPVFRRAPRVIREGVLFPYLSGAGFVHELWRSLQPRARYPAPLDSLLPQSTEQVLRPAERFVALRDHPATVRIDSIPAGWQLVRDNELGQLETEIYLHEHLGPAARAAANGWDGDRYVLLTDGAGRDVLHWYSVWDTPADAAVFAAAATRAAERMPQHDARVRIIPDAAGSIVYIVIARAGSAAADMPAPRVHVTRR